MNSRQISGPVVLIQLSLPKQKHRLPSLLAASTALGFSSAQCKLMWCDSEEKLYSGNKLGNSLCSEIKRSSNKPQRERYCFMLLLCIEIVYSKLRNRITIQSFFPFHPNGGVGENEILCHNQEKVGNVKHHKVRRVKT